jgi:hypothetical protein
MKFVRIIFAVVLGYSCGNLTLNQQNVINNSHGSYIHGTGPMSNFISQLTSVKYGPEAEAFCLTKEIL